MLQNAESSPSCPLPDHAIFYFDDKTPRLGTTCWSAHIHAARSYHPNGVSACLADGPVHFVHDGIDQFVREGLASINGKEVADETAL